MPKNKSIGSKLPENQDSKSPNEHGYCPHCGTNLDGGDILEYFIASGRTREQAMETARNYGYRKGHTQWGRQIGIEYDHDCIEEWQCPDCNGKWPRDFNKERI